MIALGSDHAGLPLKKEIIALLEEMNIPYHDYGTYTSDSCDYAMFAQRAAKPSSAANVSAAFSAADICIDICGSIGNIPSTSTVQSSQAIPFLILFVCLMCYLLTSILPN